MQVKHLSIRHFRGVKTLDWPIGGQMICLVGPGDSTKTTILDAIEYALWPRWSPPITDADFHNGDSNCAIEIIATISQIPQELLRDDRLGLHISGWHAHKGIQHDPDNDCDTVLRVRLKVDKSLEPDWAIVKGGDEVCKIGWKDRARLGVARLCAEVDRDLAWGRGSALSRLTPNDASGAAFLPEAIRSFRAAAHNGMSPLADTATKVGSAARKLGVYGENKYEPMVDAMSVSVGVGAISLHEGGVPVRAKGLGSRRLAALAIQRMVVADGAIVLIDEVEHALEPHRIRRLLRALRDGLPPPSAALPDNPDANGQIIMTTHSPTPVIALNVNELRVVRANSGTTDIRLIPADLQGTIRKLPDALLAKKVIVCEGPTEVGFLRAIEERRWQQTHNGFSLACYGVVPCNGEGSNAPKRAKDLATLGYAVAFFGDSDEPIHPTSEELAEARIKVVLWKDRTNIEQRICTDVPLTALQSILDWVAHEKGEVSVIDSLKHQFTAGVRLPNLKINDWPGDESQKRDAIAKAATAKKNKWFKSVEGATQLGETVASVIADIPASDLAQKLADLEEWAYAE